MEIRYQQRINNDVGISDQLLKVEPIVIDYSRFYKNNQVSDSNDLTLIIDGDHINDPLIQNDNLIITDKIDAFANKYYYQYQPMFDCAYPNNIQLYDSNGDQLNYQVEYGYTRYIPPSGTDVQNLLSQNSIYAYDTLDGHTNIGKAEGTPIYSGIETFNPPNNQKIPFQIFGQLLYNGRVYYSGSLFSALETGTMSMFVFIRDVVNDYTLSNIITSGVDYIGTQKTGAAYSFEYSIGASTGSASVDSNKWYRIDYYFSNLAGTSVLSIQDIIDGTTVAGTPAAITSSMFAGLGSTDKVYVESDKTACFDMGLFSGTLGDEGIGIQDPLFVGRYSKSLHWSSTPYAAGPYRIRILMETNEEAYMVYDGYDQNGNFFQNRKEVINHRLIYKKYANSTDADWYYDGSNVYIIGYLGSIKSSGDTLYVKTMSSENVSVSYDTYDRKIHVHEGQFRGDNYGIGGNLDVYYIPEYEKMPFATDGQPLVKPYYLKMVREKASLLTPYTIQVGSFYMYEGDYPEYDIPNAYEIYRYFDPNGVYTVVDSPVTLNYQTARGINVYKNGRLLNNAEIVNYDMAKGTIEFSNTFNADDNIEVTYLRYMPDFILAYPTINPLLTDNRNFRIYMRPYYQNYRIQNPDDTQQDERLCYRILSNGIPIGPYLSCYDNSEIGVSTVAKHESRFIQLADVVVSITHENSDIRERGGGIKEDYKSEYKKWPAFLDIGYGVDGKLLYNSIVFIKIPWSVVTNLTTYNFIGTEADAVLYVKQTIEQYIGSGVFYVLIDSENKLWKDPYPSTIVVKQ